MIVLKNWLYNKYFDLIFILSPPFFTLGLVYYFQDQFLAISDMPLYAWVILVLFIDVSHVYSTIFRTYLHEIEFKENRPLYILIPILVWILGVFLYSIHMKVFWSVLAYFAVYHFARQQYGFLRLYSRSEEYNAVSKWVDSILLYVSILYPIVFWHVNLPRKFNWFIEGDFIFHLPPIH